MLCDEIVELSKYIEDTEKRLNALSQQIPAVARVYSVPGIGILTATALYAFVGDPLRFPSGRHLASFIGLTPREYSSGSHCYLGRISKRGDAYLRMLLVHGARAILWHAKRLERPDRAWVLRLEKKIGHNKAAVALANKMTRIAWAVWKNDRDFEPVPDVQAAWKPRSIAQPTQRMLRREVGVMAEQVGSALGKPITTLALEAAVIDWLPCAWIPSWPGAPEAPAERPQIRLQSVPLAIAQDRNDAANNNDGAL